jgi:hypothetical protein
MNCIIPKYTLALVLLLGGAADASADVVVQNRHAKLVIGDDGTVRSLVHKTTGEELIDAAAAAPLCAIKQYRPYDNENFLMFPAKPRTFAANKCSRSGDTLRVEFQDTYDIAFIKVNETDDYIAFDFVGRDYRIEDFGVKRKTEIDEFALLQLPAKPRPHFGEWLNVVWDDANALAVMATAPTTYIDAFANHNYTTLYAGTQDAVKLYNSGAALVVASPDSLLNCIDRLEADYAMPRGVQSRRCAEYPYSYYELRDVTSRNIDRNIELAKQGGFHTMVIYYVDFAKACGHYEWRDEYPNGMADLAEITSKIRAAGMIPGLHIHYSKVAVDDPYINNGTPDSRVNYVRQFTLAAPVDTSATTLYVEENPEGVRMEDERRLLRVGDELIMFDSISTTAPYAFFGCERGFYNSAKAPHAKGTLTRHLDVDDWPLFVRLDQNSGIQQELAERLGDIYAKAGFRFVYFDGAEDVPMPYWYNVSRSQLAVYNAMHPAPLFAEGAQKSHYGWHILSRGNAFDIFPPERIRPAMKKYTLRCAKQIANDFTSVNFGWVNYLAPSDKTIGMQPDMYEYICSKALAWDSPISLVANLDEMERHPRNGDNLSVIKLWEDAKLAKAFTAEQKAMLQDPDREFTIFKTRKGGYELYPVRQIVSDGENKTQPVRAFLFERGGKSYILYWNISGASTVTLDAPAAATLYDAAWHKQKTTHNREGQLLLPADNRRILELDLPADEAEALFRKSIIK